MVEIPKGIHGEHDYEVGYPAWFSVVTTEGRQLKPIIRCNCGWFCGIGLHHVHPDGTVTRSFHHTQECDPGRGCGWHIYLKLLDWTGEEFPPNT